MVNFVKDFKDRSPSVGKFYPLRKDSLVLTDPGSYRTGVDEKEMCATFIISTEVEDRVGDIVKAQGCNLDNFRRNPIGFFGHQEMILPIGKWENREGNLTVFPKEKHIEGTLYFSQRSKEAYQVFSLVAEGILRATSIGFAPLSEPQRRRDIEGYLYDNWELLEASVVGIPCNPLATVIREKLDRGKIAGHRISPHLRKSLEPLAAPRKVTLALPIDTMIGVAMAKQMNESSGEMGGYLQETLEDEDKKPITDADGNTIKAPMDEGEDEGAEPPEGEEGPVEEKIIAGKAYQIAAKILPDKVRSDLEACVSEKIPKIAEDHPEMSQDQREAVAYSMCGEKAFATFKAVEMEPANTEKPDEVMQPEGGAGKAGAEYIKAYCGLHKEHRPMQENDELGDLMDEHKDALVKMANEKYPEAIPEEGTGEEGKSEEDAHQAANDAVKPYASVPRSFSGHLTKSMKVRGMKVIRDASDHLHAVSRLPQDEITKMHTKAFETAHGHARALDALQGALAHEMEVPDKPTLNESNTGTQTPAEQVGQEKELELDLEKILAHMAPLSARVGNVFDSYRRVTGAKNGN